MLIGITGTDGAGETVWETVARPCQVFLEVTKRNIDKVYSSCKERVNEEGSGSDYSEFMSRFALHRANRWTQAVTYFLCS